MSSGRTIEHIDRDLEIERAILVYEDRNGRKSNGSCATWRHIDSLLDERLLLMLPVVPRLPDTAPRRQHGGVVRGT